MRSGSRRCSLGPGVTDEDPGDDDQPSHADAPWMRRRVEGDRMIPRKRSGLLRPSGLSYGSSTTGLNSRAIF